ncbi:hypothetical protein Tco_0977617 [Tanacetum coccineum]|uniref:Uncharacterized protein n=1 Tax=Tanacetum coccineum TaxID=301880 RepID=A0ABQ5EKK8_9ASTR
MPPITAVGNENCSQETRREKRSQYLELRRASQMCYDRVPKSSESIKDSWSRNQPKVCSNAPIIDGDEFQIVKNEFILKSFKKNKRILDSGWLQAFDSETRPTLLNVKILNVALLLWE